MSLRYLASMNQTQLGASMITSISEAPSSPPASKPSGGGTLSHNLTTTLRSSGGHGSDGNADCHKTGNQAWGAIWRSDRKTFQVTASSLLALLKCFNLLARISAKTGSYRSMMRLSLKSAVMNTPLGEKWPFSEFMRCLGARYVLW